MVTAFHTLIVLFVVVERCELCNDRQRSVLLILDMVIRVVSCSIEAGKGAIVDALANSNWIFNAFECAFTAWIRW